MATSEERVLQRERDRGRAAALNLAGRAPDMDGTALIAEQDSIPLWGEQAIYKTKHVGFPVQDGDQVYTIQQPHTPAHNPGFRPADLPAIYSIKHTQDPARAKPYMPPNGTSGVYRQGDCCIYNGVVYRSIYGSDNVWAPDAFPSGWEEVEGS